MAEAHFLKKRQSIPVKRFESDDFLIKSSKSRSKRPYVHKATFKTKDQLREEIRVLESKVSILSRQVKYYESICVETAPWKKPDQISFKLLKPCLKRRRSDLNEDSNDSNIKKPNVIDVTEKYKKLQCTECDITFEKEQTYINHNIDLHSPIELFSSDENSTSSLSKSQTFKKSDNLSLIKNAKTRKRMRSDNNNASSSKKVRPNLMKISTNTSADVEKPDEPEIELIQELQNIKPSVMECKECGVIFEHEFDQKNHFITEHLKSKVSKSRDESIELQIKQELISMGSSFQMTCKDARNVTKTMKKRSNSNVASGSKKVRPNTSIVVEKPDEPNSLGNESIERQDQAPLSQVSKELTQSSAKST